MGKKGHVTRIFTPEEIEEWDLPWGVEGMVKEDQIIDHSRWSVWHQLIFQAPDDGKFWSLSYQRPATEMQECDRWPDLTGVQVEPYEVTEVRYREVKASDGDIS